ncbi:MAG: alpha/beta hydrolase [Gammaproteobacteria bacterium]|nr:alpha/beta hydrolase [Gammaproteobacteria bacterium]
MRWRYRRTGRGPAVVLQHGFLCGPGYFEQLADALSDRYDVIVPTLPGFADHASRPALDSIADFAEYLLGMLDHAGVNRFHLLGHSMGGMIAQEVALKSGARGARLSLFGTVPIGEMPGRFETLEESRRRVEANGPENMIGRTVATWFMRGEEDPSFPDALAVARTASLDAILGGYRAMQDWRSLERLGEIRNPTLIVWGDGDRSYRRSQVDSLRRGIPDSRLAVMPGCSHNAHLENPKCFHDCVTDFLDG